MTANIRDDGWTVSLFIFVQCRQSPYIIHTVVYCTHPTERRLPVTVYSVCVLVTPSCHPQQKQKQKRQQRKSDRRDGAIAETLRKRKWPFSSIRKQQYHGIPKQKHNWSGNDEILVLYSALLLPSVIAANANIGMVTIVLHCDDGSHSTAPNVASSILCSLSSQHFQLDAGLGTILDRFESNSDSSDGTHGHRYEFDRNLRQYVGSNKSLDSSNDEMDLIDCTSAVAVFCAALSGDILCSSLLDSTSQSQWSKAKTSTGNARDADGRMEASRRASR